MAEDFIVALETNISFKEISINIPSGDQSWCSASLNEEGELEISLGQNGEDKERSTTIALSHNAVNDEIRVSQGMAEFVSDTRLKVKGVTATSEETSNGDFRAINMIDGDKLSYFNSKFGYITDWPFLITFDLEGNETLDYLVYYPRMDAGNKWGAFGKFELWAATKDRPALEKLGEYDFEEKLVSSLIELPEPLKDVTKVEFRVLSALESRVSCGEMEFYSRRGNEFDWGDVFTDITCSELKKGVTKEEIDKMSSPFFKQIALSMLMGTYDSQFRIQAYRPYQHPDMMPRINKSSAHSLRDNPTGIYVDNTEEKLIVLVGENHAEKLNLEICNLKPTIHSVIYPLMRGVNIIEPAQTGLIYIRNHTNEEIPLHPKEASILKDKTVKIHIATGKVNGYFKRDVHDAAFWNEVLNGDKYGIAGDIDVIGRYAHTVWSLEDYRKYDTDIVTMIEYFDNAVYGQMEFAGLVKYGKMFNNRAYLHINYDLREGVGAYSTSYRTAYNFNGYANVFCTEEYFKERIWVVGHEVGHSNQVRPGMRWHGTGEITNNLYALYNQEQVWGRAKRLDGEYANAVDYFVRNKAVWSERENPNDIYERVMLKLVPLWQLKLYFVDILGQDDFYKDLYEYCRNTDYEDLRFQLPNPDGLIQLDFMRQVCLIGQRNMLPFFEDWGMLRPTDQVIKDSSLNKRIMITQDQIDKLKQEIEEYQFKTPDIGIELYELNDMNYKNYIGKEK